MSDLPLRRFLQATSIALCFLTWFCQSSRVEAESPTTQSIIESSLARLSDPDPAAREAARVELMGLSANDLPSLRTTLKAMRTLRPGMAESLHDIVRHVYLAGENQDGDPDRGFMGVKMRLDYASVRTDSGDDESNLPLGVVVDSRVPGFAAYRLLRDGDIILAIGLDGQDEQRIHSSYDITGLVGKLPAGQRISLQILRGGRKTTVQLTLDARPKDLAAIQPNQPQVTFERFREQQDEKAEDYWSKNFAMIVDGSIS